MKAKEINPNRINKSKDLNGLRRLEIKGTFVFIKICSRSDIGNMIRNGTPVICYNTIDDVISFHWINIFYTRKKRKGNQFGVIFPFKTGEPKKENALYKDEIS